MRFRGAEARVFRFLWVDRCIYGLSGKSFVTAGILPAVAGGVLAASFGYGVQSLASGVRLEAGRHGRLEARRYVGNRSGVAFSKERAEGLASPFAARSARPRHVAPTTRGFAPRPACGANGLLPSASGASCFAPVRPSSPAADPWSERNAVGKSGPPAPDPRDRLGPGCMSRQVLLPP